MEAEIREEAIRLAEAAAVPWKRKGSEIVLYDGLGKPYCYVTPTMVKPMTYVGSPRHERAVRLGGTPEPGVNTDTGLRCMQLPSGELGRAWLRDDIQRLGDGFLRSAEAAEHASGPLTRNAGRPRVERLWELTEPSAVHRAIEEFRSRGRDEFLTHYGLDRSRDYFIVEDGELFDSKPVLSVAYGYQYPEHGPLSVSRFNGGLGGAVPALRRLGFETVTPAQLHPPETGDEYANRTEIYEKFGGDTVAAIVRFPGDAVVNVLSDAEGPDADSEPSLGQPFGYRGEGLNGPQRVEAGGNAYLEEAMLAQSPIRFWYRPRGGRFTFVSWVVVLGRAWVSGVGLDKVARPEIEWQLQAVPGPQRSTWPEAVIDTVTDSLASQADGTPTPEAQAEMSYATLVARVEARGQRRRPSGVVRTDYPRSAAAKRAVLERSQGFCESPWCTGMPPEPNRSGRPILDVDHIQDLALGGDDYPLNMIALCPNCHAAKTRGAHPGRWRRELLNVAEAAHLRAMNGLS